MKGHHHGLVALSLALVLAGCEDDVLIDVGGASDAGASAARPATPGASATAAVAASAGRTPPPMVEYTENDFVESEDGRDPFRSYSEMFVQARKDGPRPDLVSKATAYALDELKLSGIITRGGNRVMLTDPSGFGWVVYTGEYIGKPELVSSGGPHGEDVALYWRVDRIREGDVVFVREDAAHPEIPPTTRVMLLHPTEERGLQGGAG